MSATAESSSQPMTANIAELARKDDELTVIRELVNPDSSRGGSIPERINPAERRSPSCLRDRSRAGTDGLSVDVQHLHMFGIERQEVLVTKREGLGAAGPSGTAYKSLTVFGYRPLVSNSAYANAPSIDVVDINANSIALSDALTGIYCSTHLSSTKDDTRIAIDDGTLISMDVDSDWDLVGKTTSDGNGWVLGSLEASKYVDELLADDDVTFGPDVILDDKDSVAGIVDERAPDQLIESIDVPDTQTTRLLNRADEFGGNVMEILHIITKESIKEDNETKRVKLQKLDDYNKISKALDQSLDSLADSSEELASREDKDESDKKVRVRYDLYDTETVGPDRQPVKTGTFSANMSRNALSTEMKQLENRMEELRNSKQKVTNEFQHLDQIVNQTMQGIARLLRALGQMRTGTGIATAGM
jgi:hypothetical protein